MTRRKPRPLPKGDTLLTPAASPARQAVETRSAAPLLFLHQLPAWTLPVAMAVLMVAGLALRGPGGAAALAILALVLGWLGAVSWPRLGAAPRLLRVLTIAAVLTAAVVQATR